jgi:hypothetical protein
MGKSNILELLRDPKIPKGLTPDLKYVDTFIAYTPVSATTGSITTINWPVYGTAANQRVGDRIRIVNIEWRCQEKITGGDYVDCLRSILVQENGESVGTPTMVSVLQESGSSVFCYSPYLYNVRNIYTPILDTFDSLSSAGSSAIVIHSLARKPHIPDIRFIAGGNVPYSGALYFLSLADNSSAATALYGVMRVWFLDH